MSLEILPNAIYTTKETRALLRMGLKKALTLVACGELKASLSGNKYVYLGKDLLDYLERNKVKPK